MIYTAYSSDINKLLSLPETGMGYQIIEGKLSGSVLARKYVVYNSEIFVDLDSEFLVYKKKVTESGYLEIFSEIKRLNIQTDSITLLSRYVISEYRVMNESKKSNKRRHTGGKGAKDNPKVNADGREIFVRLSAFENDKRIDFDKKKLKNGAFATTQVDYNDCVYTDDDPIDRYALPNDDQIKWAFYIQPKSYDSLQRGIAQPAFEHDGGGIELYFEEGTSENTYFNKKPYGK
jgi:hypothetical protein